MNAELYSLMGEAAAGFRPFYADAMQRANDSAGLEEHDWSTLFSAMGAEPEPVTTERLALYMPYYTVVQLRKALEGATSRGLLARGTTEKYRLTDAGRRAVMDSFAAAHAGMAPLQPLPAPELERLVALLRRLVDAALAAPEPVDKPHLRMSRLTDPGPSAAAAVRIDQLITDLTHFRDDAHVAAWRSGELPGPHWEVLTLIWTGEADGAAAIAERRPRRGQTAEGFQRMLAELEARGLVVADGGTYRVTAEGRRLRDESEHMTDTYFFAPWAALNEDELRELRALLTGFYDALKAYSPQEAAIGQPAG